MKVLDQTVLDEIVRRLVAEFAPEQIILFGSHAWGTPNDDSDIDLCVIVGESAQRSIERTTKAYAALAGMRVSKDILVKTRAEFEFYATVFSSLESTIHRKGKTLYDRSKTIVAQRMVAKSI
jgi:uncharacterized protein